MIAPILIACLASITVPVFAQQTALEIVQRSLDLENRNWRQAKDYTYQRNEVIRESDGNGQVKSTKARALDVLMVYGRPYSRLIEKDGKPLSASESEKEEERLRKEMEKRRRQSQEENSKERREYEKRRAEQRKFLAEIPEAFTFRMAGEETVSGHPAWVVRAEPKPGYRPRDARARMFAKIRGKLWIDKAEYQWVKIEAETTETISFGLFLARLAGGSNFRFEQKRVNGEVWLPAHAEISLEGRLALVKKLRAGIDITYSNYRKFQTDSKVVPIQDH